MKVTDHTIGDFKHLSVSAPSLPLTHQSSRTSNSKPPVWVDHVLGPPFYCRNYLKVRWCTMQSCSVLAVSAACATHTVLSVYQLLYMEV